MDHVVLETPVPVNQVLQLAGHIRIGRWLKPRWLVYQTKVKSGLGNDQVLIYADTFWRKSSALKAYKAAEARMHVVAGVVSIGSRRWPNLARIPTDDR